MAKQGIYPAPIYEAVTADGSKFRFSFWSQDGKPIDVAAGRRCAEEILLADWDAPPIWERSLGFWRGLRAKSGTVKEQRPIRGYAAWDRRVQNGYSGKRYYIETNCTKRYFEFILGPMEFETIDRGAIVERWVEHPSIGRIADVPDARPEPAKRPSWKKLAEAARAALEAGDAATALALLKAA